MWTRPGVLRLRFAVLLVALPAARSLARSATGNARDHPSVEPSLTCCWHCYGCVRSVAVRAVRDITDFRLGSLQVSRVSQMSSFMAGPGIRFNDFLFSEPVALRNWTPKV
jgi:hypothetical protein